MEIKKNQLILLGCNGYSGAWCNAKLYQMLSFRYNLATFGVRGAKTGLERGNILVTIGDGLS